MIPDKLFNEIASKIMKFKDVYIDLNYLYQNTVYVEKRDTGNGVAYKIITKEGLWIYVSDTSVSIDSIHTMYCE